jgi:hypothetical protein
VEATVKKMGCPKQEIEFKPRQTARNKTYPILRKRERDIRNISAEWSEHRPCPAAR